MKNPDILTRQEAATLLDVSVSWLAHGNGPQPLPGYGRKVRYSKTLCERWLEEQREQAWDSTKDVAARPPRAATTRGGTASRSRAKKAVDPRARALVERLLQKNEAKGLDPKQKLRVVDGGA